MKSAGPTPRSLISHIREFFPYRGWKAMEDVKLPGRDTLMYAYFKKKDPSGCYGEKREGQEQKAYQRRSQSLLQETDDENLPQGNGGAMHIEADGFRVILERESADGNGLREEEGNIKNESQASGTLQDRENNGENKEQDNQDWRQKNQGLDFRNTGFMVPLRQLRKESCKS